MGVTNKQAYEAAYRRGREGRSARTVVEWLMYPFEDVYTRQSREQGHREGTAARAGAADRNTAAA
jgi:hypothetical protein